MGQASRKVRRFFTQEEVDEEVEGEVAFGGIICAAPPKSQAASPWTILFFWKNALKAQSQCARRVFGW